MNTRTRTRIGALTYIAVSLAVFAASVTMGWCDGETYEREMIEGWLIGTPMSRTRLTTCGMMRGMLGDAVSGVPCQLWNLAPLTLVSVFAAWWLIGDLLGLRRPHGSRTARRRRRTEDDD